MSYAELLERVPFFAALNSDELEHLSESVRRRRYARNEVIFHRDDPGDSLMIIRSGVVKIALNSEDGKEVILTLLSEGDYFGDFALLDGEPRSADAVALEATDVLSLPREVFIGFLRSHPDASLALMAALSRQLRRLTDTVHDTSFLDVPARLARVLINLVDEVPDGTDGAPRTRRLTQNDLAALVGATRESVNKWLGFFERRGAIARQRGYVVVLDKKELERRAH